MRIACSFLALFPILATAQTSTCKSPVTGDLTIVAFPNKTFGTAGFLSTWLPPGYASPANASRRYPVLYMLDGQILFDDCRGGVPEWHIDETLTRLIQAGRIEPLIVVGIDPGQRMHEFLPWKDTVFSPASPEPAGRQFPDFLASEVVPFVAADIASRRDRRRSEGRPMAASPLCTPCFNGRIFSLLDCWRAHLWRWATDNCFAIRSTSLKGPARVYLGMGGRESGGRAESAENLGYVEMARTLERDLKSIAVDPPAILTVIQPDAQHTPSAWATRFETAIEFLYPKK